jgi:hypothetical protein
MQNHKEFEAAAEKHGAGMWEFCIFGLQEKRRQAGKSASQIIFIPLKIN